MPPLIRLPYGVLRGWAHDWDPINGDVRFTKSLEDAALFDLKGADYVARNLRGCVYDTEAEHLLTLDERGELHCTSHASLSPIRGEE